MLGEVWVGEGGAFEGEFHDGDCCIGPGSSAGAHVLDRCGSVEEGPVDIFEIFFVVADLDGEETARTLLHVEVGFDELILGEVGEVVHPCLVGEGGVAVDFLVLLQVLNVDVHSVTFLAF